MNNQKDLQPTNSIDESQQDKVKWLFKCGQCQQPFLEIEKLREHTMTHKTNNARILQCNICNSSFDYPGQIKKHSLLHVETPFKCELCYTFYNSRMGVWRHIKITHGKDPAKESTGFHCDYCPKMFTTPKSLEMHIRTYHALKRKRSQLGKLEMSKKNDKKKVTGKTPSNDLVAESQTSHCEHCNKIFKTKLSMLEHVADKHKDIRFSCHVCTRSFKKKHFLQMHIRQRHTLKCQHCNQVFEKKVLLAQHIDTEHPDLESDKCLQIPDDFECDLCKHVFESNENLLEHMELAHPTDESGEIDIKDSIEIGKYECDRCDEVFESFHELEYHGKLHIKRFRDEHMV